jgi:multidrug resistance efflux pump
MDLLEDRQKTIVSGVVAIFAFIAIAAFWAGGDEPAIARAGTFKPTAIAESGPFDIYVVETATLDAKQSVTLSSSLPSDRAKIIYLVPEGEYLERGDLVARFDPAPFESDIQRYRNEIVEAQAFLKQSQAELKLQEHNGEDRVQTLDYQIELAKLRITKLLEADFPARIDRARQAEEKAGADYQRTARALQTEEELLEQGYTRQSRVQEIRDRERELFAHLESSRRDLVALETVTLPAERKQAELDLANLERELEGFRSVHEQNIAKQKASLLRMQSRLTSLEQSIEQARKYLEETSIFATVSGIVRYKTIAIGNEKRKPQVGDSVWNHQGFAVIPDMSSMVAFLNVRESDIGKLAVGQPAAVSPEAYSRLTLTGTVETIGTLAADAGTDQGRNYFRVRVGLHDSDPRLRPGMSAKTSILAHHFDDVVRVPVESIFYADNQSVCFLWRNGRPLIQPVTLGESDGSFVVIEQGVSEGQEVMLVYPDAFDA